jgi:hypothetical protein
MTTNTTPPPEAPTATQRGPLRGEDFGVVKLNIAGWAGA